MNKNRTFIWCTLEVEGVHFWPIPNEEKYLQNLHRHLFKIRVSVEVKNDNREIEFIALKRWILTKIRAQYGYGLVDWRDMSCEQIAKWILMNVSSYYGHDRHYVVDVSEDGENGSEIISIPEHKHD